MRISNRLFAVLGCLALLLSTCLFAAAIAIAAAATRLRAATGLKSSVVR